MASSFLNNRYQILDTLGHGGFGHTYLAEDTHLPSRRRCVIKQLTLTAGTEAKQTLIQERFEREASVLETLGRQHPQIPELHAYFCEQGQFYLVQEWIEGETLTQQVRRGGFWTGAAVQHLLQQILPVLDYVHSRRIIHRDIKPDNIILRAADGLPVLIDFGAVKEAVQDSDLPSLSSVVIGTPGFMSSEQAAGRPTYSSDLYSLALTSLFLLTGQLPSEIPCDPISGDLQWRQGLSSSQGQLSQSLVRVLDRALNLHPRDRFGSAAEMLAALSSEAANSQLQTIAVAPAAPSQIVTQVTAPKTPTQSPKAPSSAVSPVALSDLPQLVAPPRRLLMGGLLSVGLLLGSIALGLELHESRRFEGEDSRRSQSENIPRPKSTDFPSESSTSGEDNLGNPLPQEDEEWIERKTIDDDRDPASAEDNDQDVAPEPIPEPIPEATAEPIPEPIPEPTADPTPEATVEPIPEQTEPLDPNPDEESSLEAPVFDSTIPPLESDNPEKHFLPQGNSNILGEEKLNLLD